MDRGIVVALQTDASNASIATTSDRIICIGQNTFTLDRVFRGFDAAIPALWAIVEEQCVMSDSPDERFVNHRVLLVGPNARSVFGALVAAVPPTRSSGSTNFIDIALVAGLRQSRRVTEMTIAFFAVTRDFGTVMTVIMQSPAESASLAAVDPTTLLVVCLSADSEKSIEESVSALRCAAALCEQYPRRPTPRDTHPSSKQLREMLRIAEEERDLLTEHVETLEKLLEGTKAATRAAYRRQTIEASTQSSPLLPDASIEGNQALVERLTAELAAANANATKHRAAELRLVAEFQTREREWQSELRELTRANQLLRKELDRAHFVAMSQQLTMSRVADAVSKEHQREASIISAATEKLRSLSPVRQSPKLRDALSRCCILSPADDVSGHDSLAAMAAHSGEPSSQQRGVRSLQF